MTVDNDAANEVLARADTECDALWGIVGSVEADTRNDGVVIKLGD
jgi:hypothetical protein